MDVNKRNWGQFLINYLKNVDPYLFLVVLLSAYIPVIGIHLYFRHDDAGTLLWAMEFKKNILYAFDPRPWFDEYNVYNGVGGYYRPFESLYIMLLIKIFGPEPFYFQLINGIMVIFTIVFVYKIAVLLSNRLAGLLTVMIFHLVFQSVLYGNYHVVVPFGFLFQLITFYLFIKGLNENKLKTILIGFLFLIPATNRQTVALILTAIVTIYFVTHWHNSEFKVPTRILIFLMALIPNTLIMFTKNSTHATILNQPFSLAGYFTYIWERLLFYANLMTTHLPGMIILAIMIIFWMTGIPYRKIAPRLSKKVALILTIPASFLLTFLFLKIQLLGIILLFTTLVSLFVINKRLQPVLTWFFVSLGLFSIINFYHDAYFLEAAYALAIILGTVLFDSLERFQYAFKINVTPQLEKLSFVMATCLIVISGILIWKLPSLPVIGEKVAAVKILIETNKNFKEMIEYIAEELPPNIKVFQLSEEYLRLTMNERRFLSLRERAENVKVINILNSNVMIKVLGRWDIEFKHAEGLISGIPENCVFIVHNKLEKRIAENKFHLQPIKQFRNRNTEAVVYKVLGIKENVTVVN